MTGPGLFMWKTAKNGVNCTSVNTFVNSSAIYTKLIYYAEILVKSVSSVRLYSNSIEVRIYPFLYQNFVPEHLVIDGRYLSNNPFLGPFPLLSISCLHVLCQPHISHLTVIPNPISIT